MPNSPILSPIHHAQLVVENVEESLRFYRDVLGWQVLMDAEIPGFAGSKLPGMELKGRSIILQQAKGADYGMIELIYLSHAERPGPSRKVIFNQIGIRGMCFRVKNIDEAYTELSAKGIKFYGPTQVMNFPGYRIKSLMFSDPDGNIIEIIQFIGRPSA